VDLIAIKVVTASVVSVLVILQGLIMVQLFHKTRLFPLAPGSLAAWHRRQGYVLLGLFLLVGSLCVTRARIDWGDWRPVVHALFATLALLAVVSKILLVHVFPRATRIVPAVGIVLFVAALVTTGTTVPWYLYMWPVQGVRPY
jgi:Family of unknown function (DUF6529)